jgi:hypothetical protein
MCETEGGAVICPWQALCGGGAIGAEGGAACCYFIACIVLSANTVPCLFVLYIEFASLSTRRLP